MKRILTSFALVAASLAFAQVGVNNDDPKATLHIDAKADEGTSTNTDGILIPRVDRARAQSMSSVEESTLIYVKNASTGDQTGKAVNIDAPGFYYFKGDKWVKIASSPFLGRVKGNIRSEVLPLPKTKWRDDDFTIVVTGSGTISLPDPGGENTGRIISVKNGTGALRNYAENAPLNNSTIDPQFGHILQSNGTNWYLIGGI